jgi:hypothetical protein
VRIDARQFGAAGFSGKAHFSHANETFAGEFQSMLKKPRGTP